MKSVVLILLIPFLVVCCRFDNQGEDSSTGGRDGTTSGEEEVLWTVLGSAEDSSGAPLSGVTVYIPASAGVTALHLDSLKGLSVTADCETGGGAVSCAGPTEGYCDVTCSCPDGSFRLDVLHCDQITDKVSYLVDGISGQAGMNCLSNLCATVIRISDL